jgi:hypothetical protein
MQVMGGWMTYGRMKRRNGLYEHEVLERQDYQRRITADLERMERDYLQPEYPEPPYAQRAPDSDPAAECAAATGVNVDTVRKVLGYVFRKSR